MDDKTQNMSRDFYIPDYILIPGSNILDTADVPACPVLVFVNTKSGGLRGGDLLINFRSLLNENQVFDLGEKAPDVILQDLYGNLGKLEQNGDTIACEIQRRLRIIVCGGDGTANWLLGVISDLKLPQPPPVATMPLGTGNNLPFSFGWGRKNPGTDKQSVMSFLHQVKTAKEMKIDGWRITMTMRAAKEGSYDPIGPNQSRSLNAFHRTDTSNMACSLNLHEGLHIFQGRFWNYFSMGMDAQVSYAFHSERKSHPEKFKKQLINQSTYLKLGCTQGWFCARFLHPSSRNIAQLSKVRIINRQGQWEDLPVPHSIRSIVCLNLPSFSGGLNPWGSPNRKKSHQIYCALQRGLSTPYVDDGLIEIVGFRDAWHGLVMLFPKGHGTRLAQTSRVCFEFHDDSADHTYMRIDGEPWKQPLPGDEGSVSIEISCSDQAKMLATTLCRSKNTCEPSLPVSYQAKEDHGE